MTLNSQNRQLHKIYGERNVVSEEEQFFSQVCKTGDFQMYGYINKKGLKLKMDKKKNFLHAAVSC